LLFRVPAAGGPAADANNYITTGMLIDDLHLKLAIIGDKVYAAYTKKIESNLSSYQYFITKRALGIDITDQRNADAVQILIHE